MGFRVSHLLALTRWLKTNHAGLTDTNRIQGVAQPSSGPGRSYLGAALLLRDPGGRRMKSLHDLLEQPVRYDQMTGASFCRCPAFQLSIWTCW